MIPNIDRAADQQQSYLDFLESLKGDGFRGDIGPDYANRTVLATDNSVYQILPQAVVYPRNMDDLVLLATLADDRRFRDITLTARGGGTGTNGQSLSNGLVVDLSRHMNQILEINVEERWARVQAGVVKDQLNAALKPYGLFFAPELSTSNRATVGGMISTDASGQGSCLYGKTRDHVLELNTILLGGSVLHSQALAEGEIDDYMEKQNRNGLVHRVCRDISREHAALIEASFPKLNRCLTGYDLAHIYDEQGRFNLNNILCGSEGTLGLLAEAKLKVLPIPKHSALVIVKYGDFEASLRDASALMQCEPTSIETIDSKVLQLAMQDFIWQQVEDFFADETPVPVKGINLVEYTADSEAELEAAMQALLNLLKAEKKAGRIGFATAFGHEAVNKIWAMRKRAVGLLGNAEGEARPIAFVEDTAVPPEHLADFIMEFRSLLDKYDLSYGMFGHVDAGVLHVRPALDMKDPAQRKLAWEISDQVAALTHKYHGLLWGEHGKGLRSEYAPRFFGQLYPQLQRIKYAFDPYNQLNPGKIATPSNDFHLTGIRDASTRGEFDRNINHSNWTKFGEAVYCNGNGACHNWNPDDAMCPSWKATRKRTHTPKGRASLVREWIRLLSEAGVDTREQLARAGGIANLINFPARIFNSASKIYRKKFGHNDDFSDEVYESMAACLACKSCTGQCPVKVDVPEFRSKFLALYHTRYLRPLKDHLVGSLETLLPIAGQAPALYNKVMSLNVVKFLLRTVVGFVDGPMLSSQSLKENGVEYADLHFLKSLRGEDKKRTVIIVQDAFTRYFEAQLVIDLFAVLRALGFQPLLCPFKANGKALHVHGFLSRFKRVAIKNSRYLKQYADLGFPLVGIDPSMTLTYRAEYHKYLNTSECVDVKLLQEWLVEKLDQLPVLKPEKNKRFDLLPHCTETSNATSSGKQWQQIFAALGLHLNIVNVGCCGMAGTFGHETRNRELSTKIYDLSWRKAIEARDNAQTLATGYSCRCQVKREHELQIQHPLQALRSLV